MAGASCSAPGEPAPSSTGRTAGGSRSSAATGTTTPPAPTTLASPPPAGSGSSADLVHGPRTGNAVALTFHGAGAPALTRAALRRAAAAQAQLTVMAVGTWLEQNPSLAKEILDAGHELGNHTWSHQTMTRLDPSQAQAEVRRAAEVLTTLTGSGRRWFRPSGTPRSTPTIRAAARAAGYQRCLAYDLDPLDYTDPGAAAVASRVLSALRPGSIVSLHLGHPGTVTALPAILSGLQRRGLRAVTVSHLVDGAG